MNRFLAPYVFSNIRWGLPYSGKFSLVQIFAEKGLDSSEEIFAVFIFADADTLATLLPVDGHAPYPKRH